MACSGRYQGTKQLTIAHEPIDLSSKHRLQRGRRGWVAIDLIKVAANVVTKTVTKELRAGLGEKIKTALRGKDHRRSSLAPLEAGTRCSLCLIASGICRLRA
ncbi:MAG: hypothetical protein NVS3B20_02950 [Polyangiales bacterium]